MSVPFRIVVSLLVVSACLAGVFIVAEPALAQQAVVVELFTSEGCSSCPPADALFSQLSKQRTAVSGVELILLGEHVEYWNDQGWRDRFSAPAYTRRQYDYVRQLHLATAYTPQVVIDGHLQTVGGNSGAIKQLISDSAHGTKTVKVTLEQTAPDKLKVKVSDAGAHKLKIFVAFTEDNLSTNVGGGENGGRTLKHDAVVRELQSIGTVVDGQFERVITTHAKTDWKQEDLRVVVLAQDGDSGTIRGAASIRWLATPAVTVGR